MLGHLLEDKITPKQEQYRKLSEVWKELLPAEITEHCRIEGWGAGLLEAKVDSSSHMYEMQLCSSMLVEELQQRCPRLNIRQIKYVLA